MKKVFLSFILGASLIINVDAQTNLVSDSNFEQAELTRVFSQTNPYKWYDVWTHHCHTTLEGNTTFSVSIDPERGVGGQMTNMASGIANAYLWRAYIAQRIQTTVDAAPYIFSFWAKPISGTPTTRAFLKLDGSDNFFIPNEAHLADPNKTYGLYCRNQGFDVGSTDWKFFTYEMDLSKYSPIANIKYSDAIEASETDRTNIVVCLQNNTANSTIQFDDVSLIKKTSTGFSDTHVQLKIEIKTEGNRVYVANVNGIVELFDVSGRVIDKLQTENNMAVFQLENKGYYIVKNNGNAKKLLLK